MKRILLLSFILAFAGVSIGQITTQGTVVNTSTNRLTVFAKPSVALSHVLFRNILITLSIADQGGGNPTVSLDSNFIPNFTWQSSSAQITGGRAYYFFNGTDNGNAKDTSWTTGNNPIATFTFSNNNGFATAQLNDLSGSGGGGPNGQMYWYVEIIQVGGGDITNYNAKFYGNNPPPSNDPVNTSSVGFQPLAFLPVLFKEFNVAKQGSTSALLTWTTTSEENTSHFVIERSLKDNSSWTQIAQVKAQGNSSIETKYTYSDRNIYNGRDASKIFFYRIAAYDLDGTVKYFPVRSLRFSVLGDKEISIHPNPASDGFYVNIPLNLSGDNKIRLRLLNHLGQVVTLREINVAVANNYYFQVLPGIVSGDYLLEIVYDNQTLTTRKIMINK